MPLPQAFGVGGTHVLTDAVDKHETSEALEVDPSMENEEALGTDGMDGFLSDLANAIPGIDEAMSFAEMLNIVMPLPQAFGVGGTHVLTDAVDKNETSEALEVDPSMENEEALGTDGMDGFLSDLANAIPGIDEAMSFTEMLNIVMPLPQAFGVGGTHVLTDAVDKNETSEALDQPFLPSSFLLNFASNDGTDLNNMHNVPKTWTSLMREYSMWILEEIFLEMPLLLSAIASILVMHGKLGSSAVEFLAVIGIMDPKLGVPLLLTILFYTNIFSGTGKDTNFHDMLEVDPSMENEEALGTDGMDGFLSDLANAIPGIDEAMSFAEMLNCGNKDGGTDNDGRKWESDSKYLVTSDKSVEAVAQVQDPSVPSPIPYMHARFFKSETTYKFDVNGSSRYFLRLHFYPSSYPDFNTTNSYFSVVAGGVTVLNNFSASIAAQALTQAYLMKEFSLAPLNKDSLSVTFKPSDKYNGSFAFVNGIELIPSPELFDLATMVGFDDQPLSVNSANVQTMWRLNVGGQYISPSNDSSGLGRSWYDDSPYIFSAASGVTNQADNDVTIQYRNFSASIALVDVYRTSRQMGFDGNVTKSFNLTWAFQVDGNFTYLMRLHFCEYELSKINERVFDIFINNQTAIKNADVIAWSSQKGVPFYKDFAIYVPDGAGDEMLWLALWPDNSLHPLYLDAILNGLEIFKISDANSNLAGPNPTISAMMQKQLDEEAKRAFSSDQPKKTYTTALIGGAVGGAVAFAFGSFVIKVKGPEGWSWDPDQVKYISCQLVRKYKLRASRPDFNVEVRGSAEVELGFENGLVDDIFFVPGYDIRGSVVAQAAPIFDML
ncbi:Receptor-like protein kinase ANXUR1 [Camellia lanceoleosa]|uniref:Receptor-like protein kinase ANXUR1 n=1 Tax=Camellia lanceoleosa TaxID=1840588 RepID=A0ACC0F8Q2_9ERIC|nr:Receptor-like protein kinase ANXUR1 [Camellia lanceoleosa]